MQLPPFSNNCKVTGMSDASYADTAYQYATSSLAQDNSLARKTLHKSMSPKFIIAPQHGPEALADVQKAVRFAAANKMAVAIRTGGHCYAGHSSTDNGNIQLDLSNAFKDWDYNPHSGLLRVGVSYQVMEFASLLSQNKIKKGNEWKSAPLFVPIGQCSAVNIGGHAQTGGIGQLSRAFGYFSDHIVAATIITAQGEVKEISPASDTEENRELFWATFGGGAGNYGVVTHLTLRPLKDADHQYARAYRRILPYTKG